MLALTVMKPAPPSTHEADRLGELRRLGLLDTPPEEMFDELTRFAAELCDVPMAVISLVDEHRQWFKSRVGITETETKREIAFCAHAILEQRPLIVEDALKDDRFCDNPLVAGSPNIRFYTGMPMTTRNNHNIGAFCVLDHKPRTLTPRQVAGLEVLARQATRLAELRESQRQLTAALAQNHRQRAMLLDLRVVQGEFINKPDATGAFDQLLSLALKYTESEYGFIGEVLRDEQDQPYLKSLALTNIAWDDATRKFYDDHAPQGLVFRNLNTLFGRVMTSGEMVIANDAPHDPRRGGIPSGHPPLACFLGIPIKLGGELIGMMGVANRPGGYSDAIVAEIDPLITSYGNLIQARRNRVLREQAETSLRENEARLQRVIKASGLGYWDWNMITGEIIFSGAWESMLGYQEEEVERTYEAWLRMIHPDDQGAVVQAFRNHVENRCESYAVEFRMRAKDGAWRWITAEGRVVKRAPDGTAEHITGIHKDIHDRKVVEEQARQLKENNTLIQEVHHRVKNNLQVVASLLSFQENQLAGQPEAADKFRVTRSRVGAIASLHEFLYRASYPDDVPLSALVQDLLGQSTAVFGLESGRVTFSVNCRNAVLDKSQAGPLALIINELLTNAIKHAFPRERPGVVEIGFEEDESTGWLILTVSDNGVGMPEQLTGGSGSLGITLIQRLADQLAGTIEKTNIPQGTCWRLRFPAKK